MFKFEGSKGLVVVAHPDDETLFAYTALKQKNINWTIICCTNNYNEIRKAEYKKVIMEYFGIPDANCNIWDVPDVWDGEKASGKFMANFILTKDENLKTSIAKIVPRFDFILTHNEKGEYGHAQHRSLFEIIDDICKICNKKLYVFGVNMEHLDFKNLQEKMNLLESYKSQYDLNAYDWHSNDDKNNYLMKYVTHEGFARIK